MSWERLEALGDQVLNDCLPFDSSSMLGPSQFTPIDIALPSLLRSDKIFFSLYKVGLYSSLISDVFVARLYLCLESGAISIGVDR